MMSQQNQIGEALPGFGQGLFAIERGQNLTVEVRQIGLDELQVLGIVIGNQNSPMGLVDHRHSPKLSGV